MMVEGQTNGVHQSFVDKLTAGGQIRVDSQEQSDYLVLFCPVTSGVGVDVRDALENAPGKNKKQLHMCVCVCSPTHLLFSLMRMVLYSQRINQ